VPVFFNIAGKKTRFFQLSVRDYIKENNGNKKTKSIQQHVYIMVENCRFEDQITTNGAQYAP